MHEAIQKEEIRKGILWDGDSIEFNCEKDDSVLELVNMIEDSAEQQGLSFEEMVNKIILDHVLDQLRLEILKWIRMMELNENNRMQRFKLPKPSEGGSKLGQNLFVENGDEAGLFEVCQYFISHYPEDIYSTGSDHPVSIMRDMAKDVLTRHEMSKR